MYEVKPVQWSIYRPKYDPHYKLATGVTPFCRYRVYENNSPMKSWWELQVNDDIYPIGKCGTLEQGIELANKHWNSWILQALVKVAPQPLDWEI